MIRVISGNYKGRLLSKMTSKNVRPTQARVRKSIFQILEPLEHKSVLDLFSGSGIMGIESLSRGASSVVCVEQNRDVYNFIKKNLEKICVDDNYDLLCMDAIRYINTSRKKFDVIFCDPPYDRFSYKDIFPIAKKLVNKDGYFCLEMKKQLIDDSDFRIKNFGDTQVMIWRNNE